MTTTISINQTTSLSKDKVYTGIPIELTIPNYPTGSTFSNVYLFDADDGILVFSYDNNNFYNNVNMLLYKNFGIDYSRSYVFSTSPSITPRITIPATEGTPDVTILGIFFAGIPGTPEIVNPPNNNVPGCSLSRIIQFTDYYTSLTFVNTINLNATVNVPVRWSNPNINNYGSDTAVISMVRDTGFTTRIGTFTNNQNLTNNKFINLRSGTYYLFYDFTNNKSIDKYRGSDSITKTNTFTFITERLQSVSATGGANSTNVVLNIDVGYGYADYNYLITITDTNNVSSVRRDNFPYTFSSPLSTTMTYTVVVSNSDDGNDTNTASTTFISYKNITNITIANKIIQSSQNYLTWSGGSSMEFFEYGNIQLFPIPKLNFFMNGNPLNATSLTEGTPYLIEPVETKENSKNYGNFYFDSIQSNQNPTISGPNGPFLSTSTSSILTWNAYYKSGNIAPDGNRIYDVTIGEFTGQSENNTLSISNTNVQYGISYTIDIVDIRIATNYKFYQQPSNVTISPGYINYPNIIRWDSSKNPNLNVIIGSVSLLNKISPFTTYLTEINANTNSSQIKFWPPNSTIDKAVSCLDFTLTDNTFSFWNGGTVPFFQDITFSIQVDYLYPQDVFSLFLFRNDIPVYTFKTDITLSSPFVWKPYKYEIQYLPNDTLKLQSNSHVNYGLSTFTFEIDATVNVDDTTYGIFSTVTSTLTIAVSPIPSFKVYLYSVSGIWNHYY